MNPVQHFRAAAIAVTGTGAVAFAIAKHLGMSPFEIGLMTLGMPCVVGGSLSAICHALYDHAARIDRGISNIHGALHDLRRSVETGRPKYPEPPIQNG